MQKLALFLNGEKPNKTPNIAEYDLIYCTDGSFDYLKDNNIIPDLIIGDLDSINKIPNEIEYIYTHDQNFTDFEKALQIIVNQEFKKVDVFCANGLEQDHFLGNISTANFFFSKIDICFFDDNQKYFFISKSFEISNVLEKKISLFPFPIAKKVNTNGLKYSLKNTTLDFRKNKIGIRNIAVMDTISIKFDEGNLLVFIEN